MTMSLTAPPAPPAAGPQPQTSRRIRVRPMLIVLLAVAVVSALAIGGIGLRNNSGQQLVAGGTSAGGATDPGQSGAPAPLAVPGLDQSVRSIDFANVTYPADACPAFPDGPAGGYPVRNGEYRGSGEEGALALWRTDDLVSYGDVTGDGVEDAAVMIGCAWASGVQYGWLFTVDPAAPTTPKPVGIITIDQATLVSAGLEDVLLETATIDGDTVLAQYAGFLASDARCCPSRVVTTVQRWNGSGWTFPDTPRAASAT